MGLVVTYIVSNSFFKLLILRNLFSIHVHFILPLLELKIDFGGFRCAYFVASEECCFCRVELFILVIMRFFIQRGIFSSYW